MNRRHEKRRLKQWTTKLNARDRRRGRRWMKNIISSMKDFLSSVSGGVSPNAYKAWMVLDAHVLTLARHRLRKMMKPSKSPIVQQTVRVVELDPKKEWGESPVEYTNK